MSSTRDYTRAEISDTTTNVPLLSEDSWEDGPSDPVLLINDTVEDHPSVRFSVSSAGNGSNFNSPCKLSKTTALVGIIAALIVICIVLSALLSRHKQEKVVIPSHQSTVCVTEGCIDAAFHVFHALNRSVKPCDDFYEYACGGWLQNHPIPESKSFWGIYSALQEDNERLLRQLLATPTRSPTMKKAKTFYDSCMNMTSINKMGAKPLLDIIDDLGGWSITSPDWNKTKFEFGKTLKIVQRKYSVSAFFGIDVDADDKNSSKNIIKVDQNGLALSRTYYLSNLTDPKLVAYLKYMTNIGVLLGGEENETRRQMQEVLEFEIKLAKIFVPHENRSQIDEIYNKTNIKNLTELCPQISWLDFFKNHFKDITHIENEEEVVVYATRYLAALSPVIKNASDMLLNNYLVWQVVHSFAPLLSEKFRDAHEDLIKVLTGSTRSEDLWKKCMANTDGAIGMALGKLFVDKVFDETSKQQATEMVDAVRNAFKKGLPSLEWMDEKTRKAAEDKADAVVDMIGFPDYFKDPQKLEEKYKGLNFNPKNYFQNMRNSDDFHLSKTLHMLRKPVDKHKWYMTPQTVNAYYSPSRNQIVFPAGILQAPYYNRKFPKVVNFGEIGAVVGHELTHAFDNSGRMYDKYGNYGTLWWTQKSVGQYEKRSACMIDQYSQFSYFNKKVKGKVTLGENIADNGGLKAAYNAYKEWEKKEGVEPPLPLLNMTADQTFFTAFAQSWCANIREQVAIVRLDSDSHSPDKFRVLGSLSNSEDFAAAFKCDLGSKMNPKKKCHIW